MERIICCFFGLLAEAAILWLYACALFSPKRSAKVRVFVLSALYLCQFAISVFDLRLLNICMYFLANFLFLTTQYQLKWLSAFFHAAVQTALMAMCELPVYTVIECFAPHFFSEASSFHNMVLFLICSKLLLFMTVFILIHLLKGRRKYTERNDRSTLFLVVIPITSVFLMHTFIGISDSCPLSPANLRMITLSALLLLATNLLVFGINQYNQKKNLEFTEMQLLLQKEANAAEYYEILSAQHENQSILIHDIKKHLQSIDLLSEKNECDKIRSYIRHLMLSSDLKETAPLCGNEMLNAILCRYKRQCDSRHVSFHADIRKGSIDFIADNDLTSLFCNLLDNALEAACGIPDAFIEIGTGKNGKTPFTVITVRNSSRKNPFSGPDKSLVTDKPDKRRHGFGVKSIQKTVAKYNGNMQMYYRDDTLTFHTVITLKAPVIVR